MKKAGSCRARILLILPFLTLPASLAGCSDDSRTTGTMVEASDEVKAHRAAKAENYKGGAPKPAAKAKGASTRK